MRVAMRIVKASLRLHEDVGDIEARLSRGLSAEDLPAIEADCRDMLAEIAEVGDVELDIVAARRALTHGRRHAFDGRLRARERDLSRILEESRARKKEKPRHRAGVSESEKQPA